MRKELVWAGIIGITFGLIIGFGVWRVRSSVTPKDKPSATSTPQPKVGQFKIAINKPNNLDVITQNPTSVTGVTKSLSWVVVSTDKEDFLTQSLNNGTFSVDVALAPGFNRIKVSALNSDGNTTSQDVSLIYSESFQSNLSTPESATSESDISKDVANKVNASANPPKAYLGTVTDITDSTIQIKSTDSKIQQIATNKYDVTVVNTTGTTNKTVKLTDVAIGDFIIAMGYVDGNDVLDTQRILVSDSATESKIGPSLLKVTEVSSKSIVAVGVNDGKEVTITPAKNTTLESFLDNKTKAIKIANIKADDLLIVVSDNSGTPSIIRSIFDIGTR